MLDNWFTTLFGYVTRCGRTFHSDARLRDVFTIETIAIVHNNNRVHNRLGVWLIEMFDCSSRLFTTYVTAIAANENTYNRDSRLIDWRSRDFSEHLNESDSLIIHCSVGTISVDSIHCTIQYYATRSRWTMKQQNNRVQVTTIEMFIQSRQSTKASRHRASLVCVQDPLRRCEY